MISTGSRVPFLTGERIVLSLSSLSTHRSNVASRLLPYVRSSTLVKWACLSMGIGTCRVAMSIFAHGKAPAYADAWGMPHPPLVGIAARQLAWQWSAATLILWTGALGAWLVWERQR